MNDIIAKPVSFGALSAALARQLDSARAAAPVPVTASDSVFDVSDLLAACGDGAAAIAMLRKLVALASSSAPAELAQAQAAAADGQSRQAATLLHALRGSVGQLGARAYAAHCLQLEQQLRVQSAPFSEQFSQAGQLLQQTLAAGAAWLAQQPEPAPASPAQGSLDDLLHLLAEGEIGALPLYASLRPQLALSTEQLAALDQAMDGLDFSAAHALLAS
jgi:HPt (histidine-containing phosphotransfer) domain-containing protein